MRNAMLVTALTVLLFAPLPAFGQGVTQPARAWLGVGLGGGGGMEDVGGAVFMAQLVYQHSPHHLAVRGLALGEVTSDSGSPNVGELGLLYGRTRMGYMGHVSAAVGLALTAFDPCPNDDDGCIILGVPIVLDAALRVFPVAGLGAQLFGNLNAEASYAGLAVYLQLGWLPVRL
ncbi:MAG: hypothetical protein WEB88_14685 [Gemmatimonadota bacterium]